MDVNAKYPCDQTLYHEGISEHGDKATTFFAVDGHAPATLTPGNPLLAVVGTAIPAPAVNHTPMSRPSQFLYRFSYVSVYWTFIRIPCMEDGPSAKTASKRVLSLYYSHAVLTRYQFRVPIRSGVNSNRYEHGWAAKTYRSDLAALARVEILTA
jgi:hypothetical protein